MEKHERYALFIDGSLHEFIPLNMIESRMAEYGVRKPEDVYRLVSGRAVKTLGKTYLVKPENALPSTLPVEQSSQPNTKVQTKQKKRIEQDSPYGEEIGALHKRVVRFSKTGGILGAVALLGAVGGYVLSFLASSAEPTHVIEQINIPASILKVLAEASGVVGDVSKTKLEDSFASVESTLFDFLDSTIYRSVTAIYILASIFLVVLRGRLTPLLGILPLVITPYVVTAFIPDKTGGLEGSLINTASARIEQAVQDRNGPELERLLNPLENLDEQTKTFLIAQVYASEGIRHQSVLRSAKQIQDGEIKPASQTAFAIESVASNGDTSSLSPLAASYHREATEQANFWEGLVIFPWAACMIAAGVSLCFSLSVLYIRRRLRSIFSLLEQIS